jgi:hypothetical protein
MARPGNQAAAYPPELPTERLLSTAAENSSSAAAPARDGWSHTLLRQLLHLALRVRHTAAGHWLYRRVPVHWQQRFKAYLAG